MRKLFFRHGSQSEINIYADKSASILEWLLVKGIQLENFSLSEVHREIGVSIGLIQKVLAQLVYHGFIRIEGLGTAKKFVLTNPKMLLDSWISSYDIVKKCRMWGYSSAYRERNDLFEILRKSGLSDKVVIALHSSADLLDCRHSNLETLELYIPEIKNRPLIEKILRLEPQERGYDVLLIEPYYKHMVRSCLVQCQASGRLCHTRPFLTYLDLLHFPLRGIEQAEYMAENLKEIKQIFERNS